MTIHKRKKLTRYRASKTHGCGSMKKRRGAGHRGGRGNAGSGKKGDCKKPSYTTRRFGKYGFTSIHSELNAINLRHLEDGLETFVSQGVFTSKAGTYDIDLSKIKVQKLLGTGSVTKKLNIKVDVASPSAIAKVQAAGGKVTVASEESVAPTVKEAPAKEEAKAQ